jgi:DNA-binding PadR family transcriptional regulator
MKEEGRSRYLILGLLAEGPCSGYDIRRITMARFRFFWSESYGQIYPCLKRLALEGLIRQDGAAGRGKVIWAITPAGRAVLAAWLAGPTQAESARYESILKFYFSWAMPAADTRRLLEDFAGRQEASLAELEGFRRQLVAIPDPHGNHHLALATVDLGIATYRVWRDWAESRLADYGGAKKQSAGSRMPGETDPRQAKPQKEMS